MIHTVKCYPEYFKLLLDGSKPFEVRENDRIYEVGDYLAVNEFLPEEDPYTLRKNPPEKTVNSIALRTTDIIRESALCSESHIFWITRNSARRGK